MIWACAEEKQRMLTMELPDRRFMYAVKEDTQRVVVTQEDGRDRVRRRQVICCGGLITRNSL